MNGTGYLIGFIMTAFAIIGVSAHHILILHPVYAGSHILAVRRIMEQLLLRGHQIKVVRWKESSNIPPMNSPNVSETILAVNNSDGSIPFMSKEERAMFKFPDRLMWERGLLPTSVFDGGIYSVASSCETLFKEESLLQELRQTNFKLAIVDLVYNECGLALAHHLNLPVVAYWGISFVSGETQYMTAFNPPSSIPHLYVSFNDKMDFIQRSINFFYGIGSHLVMQVQFYYTNYYIQKYLKNIPHPSELLSNVSGVLINSHWVFDYPKQLPPSFFQIGGFHIRDPKPLPKDLKDFVESADEGVILFSLGKNFDSESLPPAVSEAYLKAFGRLKQKVIVKSNSELKNLTRNVKVLSYIPQADILAHPKTILFVTHGGLHGVMEAIHFGVKMIAIPIFFDQGNVAARLVGQGIAISLQKTATEADVFDAITKVISDKRYGENMRHISEMYHSSFENPLERALWLVEHVMSTNGANHLKMTTKDLNFIQYFCLDIILILSMCLAAIFYLILKILIRTGQKFIKRKDHLKLKRKLK